MSWLLDLPTQVRRRLGIRNGGTGNRYGWGRGLVIPLLNRDDDPLPIGAVVRVEEQGQVVLVDDEDATDVVGVVVGRFDGLDAITEVPPEYLEMAAVQISGVVPTLVNETVGLGQYAFPSDSAGAARGEDDPGAGAFGRFVGKGADGDLVPVKLGGSGGGGGGVTPGSNGQVLTTDSSALAWEYLLAEVEVEFVSPSPGQESRAIRIPYACQVTGWYIAADASGDIVVDVWVDTLANFPPTNSDSITASAPPTLASARTASSTSLPGWTTSLAEGSWLRFNVDSTSGITEAVVALSVRRV